MWRSARSLDQPSPDALRHRFHSIIDIEFFEDVLELAFHGGLTPEELFGDVSLYCGRSGENPSGFNQGLKG